MSKTQEIDFNGKIYFNKKNYYLNKSYIKRIMKYKDFVRNDFDKLDHFLYFRNLKEIAIFLESHDKSAVDPDGSINREFSYIVTKIFNLYSYYFDYYNFKQNNNFKSNVIVKLKLLEKKYKNLLYITKYKKSINDITNKEHTIVGFLQLLYNNTLEGMSGDMVFRSKNLHLIENYDIKEMVNKSSFNNSYKRIKKYNISRSTSEDTLVNMYTYIQYVKEKYDPYFYKYYYELNKRIDKEMDEASIKLTGYPQSKWYYIHPTIW